MFVQVDTLRIKGCVVVEVWLWFGDGLFRLLLLVFPEALHDERPSSYRDVSPRTPVVHGRNLGTVKGGPS